MADTASSTGQAPPSSEKGHRGGTRARGRGRGRARGRAGGAHSAPSQTEPNASQDLTVRPPRVSGRGRVFGGQLTRLDADAIPFVPASLPPATKLYQTKASASSQVSSSLPRKLRRPLRSSAPDIATRTHEDIAHGIYECAICTNEIARNSKVWSCHTCWTVFHLGCIKKWSKNDGSTVQQQRNQQNETEIPIGKKWRCPGCNLPKDSLPSDYSCWCEKEMDPKMITGLPPHSCGQSCGKDRKFPKACPHPCDQLCHAGPCPPCTSIGPKQSCFCGKETSTRRCIDTEYEAGWSCGAICGDLMPCGEHTCQNPCHEGLCGACDVRVDARCYCGKVEQKMMCSEQDIKKPSYGWTGVFDCRNICDRLMDCGIHKCRKVCHPRDEPTPHCQRSPDVVTHCPCGKTLLVELSTVQRETCTDPVPSCAKLCDKLRSCGHTCTQPCHTGECPPCLAKVPLTCRCGRNKFETQCFGGNFDLPQCFRTCKATLNCGRHECGERCCTGEKKAAERQATKRKLKPLGAARLVDEGIEAEHICTRVCGRPLKCGNHTCAELCHKGPCGTCREAIFDDIHCNCGRTVLQAPLPCGTRPPPCFFPCRRAKSCGHPPVNHNCHTDEEECPKCPYLTEKDCMCGKKTLKNQPCWRTEALCGLTCGKLLKCGSHTCRKTCHKPGECEDAHLHCQQQCGKAKKSCGHPCEHPCHAPSTCKEDKPCPFKIMITCDCQRKKEEVRCNARAGLPEPPGRQNSLKCDDECARLERNRVLAAALNIPDDHVNNHIPYSTDTLNMYLVDVPWAHKQEEILRLFAADDEERRYRFPPMKHHQRSFIHSIAEDFGFDGESLDPEPHRHVVLFKTPKFVAAPMKTLQQAARTKRSQLNVNASAATSANVQKRADEAVKQDFNGLLVRNPRFGLTEDELKPVVQSAAPGTDFKIFFLTNSDAIALIPTKSPSATPGTPSTPQSESALLKNLISSISAAVGQSRLASETLLASFEISSTNSEPRLIRASDAITSAVAGGWSQVATSSQRVAPRMPQTEPVGGRNMYTVLGSRLAEMKRRKAEEAELKKQRAEMERQGGVDDWEAEVDAEEELEHPHAVD